jgi:EAL domain-containing protein (putative c-di-GMP-specific phosphodiesterase class I)
LVRLRKPDQTLVPPGVFLPAAERFNLSQQIDQWVLSRFFTAYNTHQAKMPGVWSLNLSGSSLVNREILAFIHQQLKQHTITPANICFEITESEVITNIAAAIEFINDLRRIGCKFALDDFGSGLSSFAYLKALPVDYLKIDGHFVRDIDHDATDYALVQAVHQVGNSMKLKTIAEFVETEAIRAKLCQIGVNYGQGYALARPLPLHQIWTPSAELEQF